MDRVLNDSFLLIFVQSCTVHTPKNRPWTCTCWVLRTSVAYGSVCKISRSQFCPPRFFLRVDYSEFIRRQLGVIKVKKNSRDPGDGDGAEFGTRTPKSRTRPLCFEAGKSATTTVRSSFSFFFHACKLDWQVSVVHSLPGGPVWSPNQIKPTVRSAVQVQQLTRACACTAASVSRPFPPPRPPGPADLRIACCAVAVEA